MEAAELWEARYVKLLDALVVVRSTQISLERRSAHNFGNVSANDFRILPHVFSNSCPFVSEVINQ